MAAFCISSVLTRPLLRTDDDEWIVHARELSVAEEGATRNLEPLLAEHSPEKCRLTHGRTMKYVTALVVLVCLASLSAFGLQYAEDLPGFDRPSNPIDAELSRGEYSGAKALMMKYIQVRMANDMGSFKRMLDPTATMKIDVSQANSLIRAGASHSIPKLNMVGWSDIASFYANNRAQAGDKPPSANEISCAGNTCQALFVIQRGPLFLKMTLNMYTEFKFDLGKEKIESIRVIIK